MDKDREISVRFLQDFDGLLKMAVEANERGESLRWRKARIAAAASVTEKQKYAILRDDLSLSYDELEQKISNYHERLMDALGWKKESFYKAVRLAKWIHPEDRLEGYTYNDHLNLAYFEPTVDINDYPNNYDGYLAEVERRRQLDKLHRKALTVIVDGKTFSSRGERETFIKTEAERYRKNLRNGIDPNDALTELSNGYSTKKKSFLVANPTDLEDVLDFLAKLLENKGKYYANIAAEIPKGVEDTEEGDEENEWC